MRTVDEENVFVKISYRLCHIDYKIVPDDQRDQTTILDKIFGTKLKKPVKLDKASKIVI